jgi:hypothetical protein
MPFSTRRVRVVVALLVLGVTGLVDTAKGGPPCDENRPVQNQCFCECSSWNSSSRGEGACEIAERIKVWCAVSFVGRTGSIGPNSIPSAVKDTSIILEKPNFTPANGLAKAMINIPDYRTEEYATLANKYSFGIFPFGEFIPYLLRLSVARRNDSLQPELATTLFLWARGGYVSLPNSVDIGEAEFRNIDDTVARSIFSDEMVFRTFFAGQAGYIYRPSDGIVVSRGYLRIDASKDVQVRVLWRELLPND